MNDWVLGITTILVIFGGAQLYATIAMKAAPPLKLPEQFKKAPDQRVELQAALQKQVREAYVRAEAAKRLAPLEEWLELAIRHLMHLWPDMTHAQASRELRDYLSDAIAAWPGGGHQYTPESAREMAEDYMHEFGETYGSNS